MSNLPSDWTEFVELLNERGVEFLLVGAHAVAMYGRPRATQDIDFLIKNSTQNFERLLGALSEFGFGSLGLTVEDFETSFVVQLGAPPYRIDLLTKLDGVGTEEAFDKKVEFKFGSVPVFVISKDLLIQNKHATGRPRDIADIAELAEEK